MASTLFVVVGFGSIAFVGFKYGVHTMASDGKCRIGTPAIVSIPLLTFDALINILLTLAFVYLLGPVVQVNNLSSSRHSISKLALFLNSCCEHSRNRPVDVRLGNAHVVKRVEKLLWRTFVGSCLVLPPTLGNMIQLSVFNGREVGFACLTICSFDCKIRAVFTLRRTDCLVTWTVAVFHCLVLPSETEEGSSSVSVLQSAAIINRTGRHDKERVIALTGYPGHQQFVRLLRPRETQLNKDRVRLAHDPLIG